ncbi:hypothetical protein HK104_004833 [Borealophlyctis nickersoniae]|nr:hypothetical protein HK104_004833 [Borealophlyctis nickersoniae]
MKSFVQANFKPLSWQPDLSSFYTKLEVNHLFKLLTWQPDLSAYYTQLQADGRFKPVTWEPDLSNYYTRYESNAITSTLAPLDSVYTRTASLQLFKSIDWLPDLTSLAPKDSVYTKTESNDRFATFQYVEGSVQLYGYSKTESDSKYLTVAYHPPQIDLSPYALIEDVYTNIYTKVQSDTRYSPINSVFTKTESNDRFATFQHVEGAVQLYGYSKTESDTKFLSSAYQPPAIDLSPYALKTDLVDYMPVPVLYDTFAPSTNVYTISQADERFALNTDLNDMFSAVHPRDQADAAFAKSNTVYTMSQSDAKYMPITYSPPAPPDLSPYLLTSTANTLYKSINWLPDTNVYALESDLNFVQPSALTSYWTKGEADARFRRVGDWIMFETDVGHNSSDGKRRFYFGHNSRTYNYSPDGYEWRNAADTSSLLTLDNNGALCTGNVALQYNTLYLALNNDANHYISHGLSSVAGTNYNIDGVVLQGGVGGGILGQSGMTALKWLNGTVTIPGTLKVSGKVDIVEVSLPPRSASDTRPAFQVQAFTHDNQCIYFDAAWDGTDLKASFGSFFKISKFNANLWIGGGTGTIGSIANMTNFIQMTPSGLITLTNNTADALTIYGGLKVNASIYSGGNKVATEAFVNSTVSASIPWQNKASIELNSDATTNSTIYIDLHASPSDYSLHILRNAGVNGSGLIEQLGNNPVASGGSIVFESSVRHNSAVTINGFVGQTQSNGYRALDIYGVGPMPSDTSANVSLFCQYAVVSRTYYTHSDLRWKQNIRHVPHLDAFDHIDPHLYDWKDPTQPRDQIGFVAQEVLEYLPECIRSLPTENQDDDELPPLSVDYQAMSSYLWAVVKDLKAELKEIKNSLRVNEQQ